MKYRKLNKKGVLGLEIAIGFVLSILTLAIIIFAVIVALSTLNNANVLTGTAATDASNVLTNVTAGTSNLMSNAVTWFSLIAVVIIILIISVVIIAVKKFGGQTGGGL